jgi:hypothetical protein
MLESNIADIQHGINVSKLSPGMYFLEVDARDQKAVGKFIKL